VSAITCLGNGVIRDFGIVNRLLGAISASIILPPASIPLPTAPVLVVLDVEHDIPFSCPPIIHVNSQKMYVQYIMTILESIHMYKFLGMHVRVKK